MSEQMERIAEKLVAGAIDEVPKLVQQALDRGVGAQEIMDKGLVAGMDVVGQRFKDGEMFLPEVLRSAKAMTGSIDLLRPHLAETGASNIGTLVIGTVQGDLHEIGKNLVAIMFAGAGFDVVNLGVDTKPQDFVEAVKEHGASIVGMSSLLTTTMPRMAETINALKEAGLRDQVKVMVGGAPVTSDFAEEIGADGYGANAMSAVKKGKALSGR